MHLDFLLYQNSIGVLDSNLVGLITKSGLMAKAVLLILLLFSIVSWGIIFFKYRVLKSAISGSNKFRSVFRKSTSLSEVSKKVEHYKGSPLANIFHEAYQGLTAMAKPKAEDTYSTDERSQIIKRTERVLHSSVQDEASYLERYLVFLATTGNITPFIGLFGTVLGIISSFQQIGLTGSASIAAVAPGIAEALIATAAGLAAAIPAVIAYNYFLNKIRQVSIDMDSFATEFLSYVEEGLKRR
ncbi:MAG: protein TolQ [Nitrospirae bacterium]|nr:protein TolQ [Nitrospirota bacterium]